jgi:ribonuclease T1
MKAIAAVLVALASIAFAAPALAQRESPAQLATVPLHALPAEARKTVDLIHEGGPFPFARDGVVFGNREARLPKQKRGYYHEYTVPTPGARDRGARRIVSGKAGELYYSDDHYQTFRRIQDEEPAWRKR